MVRAYTLLIMIFVCSPHGKPIESTIIWRSPWRYHLMLLTVLSITTTTTRREESLGLLLLLFLQLVHCLRHAHLKWCPGIVLLMTIGWGALFLTFLAVGHLEDRLGRGVIWQHLLSTAAVVEWILIHILGRHSIVVLLLVVALLVRLYTWLLLATLTRSALHLLMPLLHLLLLLLLFTIVKLEWFKAELNGLHVAQKLV